MKMPIFFNTYMVLAIKIVQINKLPFIADDKVVSGFPAAQM